MENIGSEMKIGNRQFSKSRKLLVLIGLVITLAVFTFLAYSSFVNKKYRSIPDNWSTYNNAFYGYSFSYEPSLVQESLAYGANDGEDLGISLHSVDREKLRQGGIEQSFFSGFSRGFLIDDTHDKWNIEITKPSTDSSTDTTCRKGKTNGGLTYYECRGGYDSWNFIISLLDQNDKKLFVRANLDRPYSEYPEDEQLIIRRIINSFSFDSNATDLAYFEYPTKSDLFLWVRTYWCSDQNELYGGHEKGLLEYQRYSVISRTRNIEDTYLTQPRSFCEVDIESMPHVPASSCPYTEASQLIDNYALGASKHYAVCGGDLPIVSYENTQFGISNYMNLAISSLPGQPNKNENYWIMTSGKVAVAVPNDWNVQESPIGSCLENSCDSDFIGIRDPNNKVVVTLDKFNMERINEISSRDVNLGKFECGSYASCDLVRKYKERTDIVEPAEIYGTKNEYEYQLLVKNQSNIVAVPNKVTVRFFDDNFANALLPKIDKIVQSMVFLYKNEIND